MNLCPTFLDLVFQGPLGREDARRSERAPVVARGPSCCAACGPVCPTPESLTLRGWSVTQVTRNRSTLRVVLMPSFSELSSSPSAPSGSLQPQPVRTAFRLVQPPTQIVPLALFCLVVRTPLSVSYLKNVIDNLPSCSLLKIWKIQKNTWRKTPSPRTPPAQR